MIFKISAKVRFADVEPSGMVFYPRYFEMLNGAVEDWFSSMGHGFRAMHVERRIGVPTIRLECEFMAPCELGEELTIEINPIHVGPSSATIEYFVSRDGQGRCKGNAVLVCMDLDKKRSIRWPPPLDQQLSAWCKSN